MGLIRQIPYRHYFFEMYNCTKTRSFYLFKTLTSLEWNERIKGSINKYTPISWDVWKNWHIRGTRDFPHNGNISVRYFDKEIEIATGVYGIWGFICSGVEFNLQKSLCKGCITSRRRKEQQLRKF